MQVQGLPHPRAGSEYENDLRACSADHVNSMLEMNCRANHIDSMLEMLELLLSRLPAATPAPPPATPAATPTPHQQDIAHAEQRFDEKAAFDAAVQAAEQRFDEKAAFDAAVEAAAAAAVARIDEKAAFDAAVKAAAAVARIDANASHAAHGAATSTWPRAQDTDNAQYLEQKSDGLRFQAGTKPDYTMAARQGEFQELGQPTAVVVAAAEPETGVLREREMDKTAAAHHEIVAVALQDHYISKTTAPGAPTGSTLNEPESRAFTTDPRPHAFGTKNVNLTVYSRAMVKVGPLARIRIDDEVYT